MNGAQPDQHYSSSIDAAEQVGVRPASGTPQIQPLAGYCTRETFGVVPDQ